MVTEVHSLRRHNARTRRSEVHPDDRVVKALRQVALDIGPWRKAGPLTVLQEPGRPRRFGGSERELEVIAFHSKASDELKKRVGADRGYVDAEEEGDPERK